MTTRSSAHRIMAIADRARASVRRDVERALRALQDSVSVERLERAISSGDAFALHDIASTLPLRLRSAVATLERVFISGAHAGRASLPPGVRVMARFDSTNPYAVAAARENGARLVREVADETRQAIRTVVARSFSEGIPPRDAARLIRPLIGLTARQAKMVARHYSDAIAAGASRRAAKAEAVTLSDRLLRKRAVVIARTETIRAANAGQIAAWREAARVGLLSPRSQKVWIVTPDDRLCPLCKPLDGKRVVGLDGHFRTGLLRSVSAPPLHPNCRCAIAIRPAERKGARDYAKTAAAVAGVAAGAALLAGGVAAARGGRATVAASNVVAMRRRVTAARDIERAAMAASIAGMAAGIGGL